MNWDELETVIAIVPVPFRQGRIDYSAHERNVDFLVRRNWLDEKRKRAIAIGGTSLLHHLEGKDQIQLIQTAAQCLDSKAVLISGVLPSPLRVAKSLIRKQLELERPPDYFLLMPPPGVVNPAGVRRDLGDLINEFEDAKGRFLLYMRSRSMIPAFSRMLQEHEGLAGVKVGTTADDVETLLETAPPAKKVLWGVGDRASRAAELGSRGHTSGITLICPRLCDAIHNAYRRGEFAESYRLEGLLSDFEDIRFIEERAYNYSAVVAAAAIAGFEDIDLGEGGPFNAEPPTEVLDRLEASLEPILDYH